MVLLETGQIFESITKAHIPSITNCINKGYTSNGYHYAFLQDVPTREDQLKELQRQIEVRNQRHKFECEAKALGHSIPVIDLMTGEIYQSSQIAGSELGYSPGAVAQSIRTNMPVYSHLFSTEIDKFKDNPELRLQTYNQIIQDNANKKYERQIKAASKHAKPCRCIETGIEYPSCRAASKAIGNALHAVDIAIRTNGTAAGYHWEYILK